MAHAVEHSELTDRQARIGSFEDQRRSTWDKLSEAIAAHDEEAGVDLAEFALDGECRFIFDLLTGWADDLRRLLGESGIPGAELRTQANRLAELLAFPDGQRYDPAVGWLAVSEAVGQVIRSVRGGDWTAAAAAVPLACEAWRLLHDRVIDSSYGWMSIWVEHFGEETVPRMFELVAMDHFEEFFELADPKRRPWAEGGSDAVVLDTLEAMRAHLSTVRRDGAPIQMIEHEDRYEFEFDPCGSGGRSLRGDVVEGTPSRVQEPYNFGVIHGAYDWTDGKSGMCIYCNHCQQLYEQWTIDHSGIPFLVVDPPTAADGVGHDRPKRCRYTIYKRPESVPDEVFERCGRDRKSL